MKEAKKYIFYLKLWNGCLNRTQILCLVTVCCPFTTVSSRCKEAWAGALAHL